MSGRRAGIMSGRRTRACHSPPRIGGALSKATSKPAYKGRDFSAKPSPATVTSCRFLFNIFKKCKMDLADSQAKHYETSESVKHNLLPIRRKCLRFSW